MICYIDKMFKNLTLDLPPEHRKLKMGRVGDDLLGMYSWQEFCIWHSIYVSLVLISTQVYYKLLVWFAAAQKVEVRGLILSFITYWVLSWVKQSVPIHRLILKAFSGKSNKPYECFYRCVICFHCLRSICSYVSRQIIFQLKIKALSGFSVLPWVLAVFDCFVGLIFCTFLLLLNYVNRFFLGGGGVKHVIKSIYEYNLNISVLPNKCIKMSI